MKDNISVLELNCSQFSQAPDFLLICSRAAHSQLLSNLVLSWTEARSGPWTQYSLSWICRRLCIPAQAQVHMYACLLRYIYIIFQKKVHSQFLLKWAPLLYEANELDCHWLNFALSYWSLNTSCLLPFLFKLNWAAPSWWAQMGRTSFQHCSVLLPNQQISFQVAATYKHFRHAIS